MPSGKRGRHRRPAPLRTWAVRSIGAGGLAVLGWVVFAPATDLIASAPPSMALTLTTVDDPPPTSTALPSTVTAPLPSSSAALVAPVEVVVTTAPVIEPTVETTTTTPPPPPITTTTTTPKPPPPPPEPPAPAPKAAVASPKGNVLAAARTFLGLGIPYVWGGKTLSGLDCSGFVWKTLQKAGYDVPYRTSGALKSWATPIKKADAQPGDLVFWPGHVAIYAGNNRIVDSGTSAGPEERAIWGSPTFGRIPL